MYSGNEAKITALIYIIHDSTFITSTSHLKGQMDPSSTVPRRYKWIVTSLKSPVYLEITIDKSFI